MIILRTRHFVILLALLFVVAGVTGVHAWTAPAAAAPSGNVSAPVNVGATDQVKNAGLSVNALAVFGNAILSGAANYLNFGTVAGSSGYGIRNNNGTMEFKNNNGAWTALASSTGGGSGQWTTSGSNISYTAGNVGVGISNPSVRLHVMDNIFVDSTVSGGAASVPTMTLRGATYDWVLNNNYNQSSNFNIGSQPSGTGITTPRITITTGGNVGIGTTPTAKLHVGGTAGVDGIKFPDGTLQTTAAGSGGGGITAVTNVSCNASLTVNCTASCPATYFVTGCGGTVGASVGPSGNGCTRLSGSANGTIIAYCAK